MGPLARAPRPAVAVRRGGGAEAVAAARSRAGGVARAGEGGGALAPAAAGPSGGGVALGERQRARAALVRTQEWRGVVQRRLAA